MFVSNFKTSNSKNLKIVFGFEFENAKKKKKVIFAFCKLCNK